MKLLTVKNTKIEKSVKYGYLTAILHLAPADSSGYEVCPGRSKGCTKACNNTAGRGRFADTQCARIRKTRLLFEDPDTFFTLLYKDIESFIRKAKKLGLKPAIRLNGTSDLPWWRKEFGEVIQKYPEIMFYDYTAVLSHVNPNSPARKLDNYCQVFSRKENNMKFVERALSYGVNVAVSFELDNNKELPSSYMGYPVVSGDDHDLIFLHSGPCIIGLRYKVGYDSEAGQLIKRDISGFTILYNNELGCWQDPQTNNTDIHA